MFALRPSSVYAMSVTLVPMAVDVSSAVLQVLFTTSFIPRTNLFRYLGRVLLCRVHKTRKRSRWVPEDRESWRKQDGLVLREEKTWFVLSFRIRALINVKQDLKRAESTVAKYCSGSDFFCVEEGLFQTHRFSRYGADSSCRLASRLVTSRLKRVRSDSTTKYIFLISRMSQCFAIGTVPVVYEIFPKAM